MKYEGLVQEIESTKILSLTKSLVKLTGILPAAVRSENSQQECVIQALKTSATYAVPE